VQRPIVKDALDREEETGTALTHSQRYKYEPKKFLVLFSRTDSHGKGKAYVPRVAEIVIRAEKHPPGDFRLFLRGFFIR